MPAAQRFDRAECLRLVAEAYRDSVSVTQEEYEAAFRDWHVRGYGTDRLCMVVLTRGPEIHTAFGPAPFWCRLYVREAVQFLIDKYGYAMTSVRRSNARGHRFVERIGFKQYDADERHIYYRIERLSDAFLP